MANDKTINRHVNLWINGKEVKNDIASIRKEAYQLTNELANTTRGSKEYYEKLLELKKVNVILNEHKQNIRDSGNAWTKLKGFFAGAQGLIIAGAAGMLSAFQSMKGVLTSTGDISDKLEVSLAGWKSGIDAIKRSIANLDFKNFFNNIKSAIDEGRRYAEGLDEIDEKTRALRIEEEIAQSQLIEQRKIQSDVRNSLEKRNEAGKEAIKIEERLAKLRTDIADQAYKNELDNITSIAFGVGNVNDQTREQIELYLRQKKEFIDRLQPAREWQKLQQQIVGLQAQEYSLQSAGNYTYSVRNVQISNQITALKEQQKQYESEHNLLSKLMIPTDEKYTKLMEKWIELEQAKRSASENSLKIFVKNANIENQLNNSHDEIISKQITKYADLQNAISNVNKELKSYFDTQNLHITSGDEIDSILQEKRSAQIRDLENMMVIEQDNIFAVIELERKKNEILRRNEIEEAERTGASVALINSKYAKIDEKLVEEKNKTKLQLGADFFGNIATVFGEQTRVGKAAAIAETMINTYASATAAYKSLAAIPFIGPALGVAAAAAAVAAGLANIKKIRAVNTSVSKGYSAGGYTGSGGKFQPAGIVHAGEWVASSEMVQSPRTGPIIRALENERQRSGGFATGGYTESQGAGTKSDQADLTGLILTASRAIERLNGTLDRLDKHGVKTVWGYKDVDNVRKGMERLEEIEKDVTM